MIIFKNYTFTWWQVVIFKVCLLSLGIAIGAYWADFFVSYIRTLLTLAVFAGIYLVYISFRS